MDLCFSITPTSSDPQTRRPNRNAFGKVEPVLVRGVPVPWHLEHWKIGLSQVEDLDDHDETHLRRGASAKTPRTRWRQTDCEFALSCHPSPSFDGGQLRRRDRFCSFSETVLRASAGPRFLRTPIAHRCIGRQRAPLPNLRVHLGERIGVFLDPEQPEQVRQRVAEVGSRAENLELTFPRRVGASSTPAIPKQVCNSSSTGR